MKRLRKTTYWIAIGVNSDSVGLFSTKTSLAKSLGVHRHTVREGRVIKSWVIARAELGKLCGI